MVKLLSLQVLRSEVCAVYRILYANLICVVDLSRPRDQSPQNRAIKRRRIERVPAALNPYVSFEAAEGGDSGDEEDEDEDDEDFINDGEPLGK